MLLLFAECNGLILETHLEPGTTVTAALCSEILKTQLKPAIRNKRRGLPSKACLALHNNAHPHSAEATVEAIRQVKSEILTPSPPSTYSPDLASSDYYMVVSIKEALRG
jgi:hypothetical protein